MGGGDESDKPGRIASRYFTHALGSPSYLVGWGGCALESVTVSGNGSCKDDDSAVEQTVQVRESDEDPWLVQTNKQTNKVKIRV
jgi:hypothetical protein